VQFSQVHHKSCTNLKELSIDEPARPAMKRAGLAVGNSVIAICTMS